MDSASPGAEGRESGPTGSLREQLQIALCEAGTADIAHEEEQNAHKSTPGQGQSASWVKGTLQRSNCHKWRKDVERHGYLRVLDSFRRNAMFEVDYQEATEQEESSPHGHASVAIEGAAIADSEVHSSSFRGTADHHNAISQNGLYQNATPEPSGNDTHPVRGVDPNRDSDTGLHPSLDPNLARPQERSSGATGAMVRLVHLERGARLPVGPQGAPASREGGEGGGAAVKLMRIEEMIHRVAMLVETRPEDMGTEMWCDRAAGHLADVLLDAVARHHLTAEAEAVVGAEAEAGAVPGCSSGTGSLLEARGNVQAGSSLVTTLERVHELTKANSLTRQKLFHAGFVAPLVDLLGMRGQPAVVELVVTVLLNLSLHGPCKKLVATERAVARLVLVLRSGSVRARENAAALLCNVADSNEERRLAGQLGAIPPLLQLLCSFSGNGPSSGGSGRAQKDAVMAVLRLALYAENRAEFTRCGAVARIVALLPGADGELEEKALAALSAIVRCVQGNEALRAAKCIPVLAEVVDGGSDRAKEEAAALLLRLVVSSKGCREEVLREGVMPSLASLAGRGTQRGRIKAEALLAILRGETDTCSGPMDNRNTI
eukprot:jgi/Mesen1/7050/ME000369S06372